MELEGREGGRGRGAYQTIQLEGLISILIPSRRRGLDTVRAPYFVREDHDRQQTSSHRFFSFSSFSPSFSLASFLLSFLPVFLSFSFPLKLRRSIYVYTSFARALIVMALSWWPSRETRGRSQEKKKKKAKTLKTCICICSGCIDIWRLGKPV